MLTFSIIMMKHPTNVQQDNPTVEYNIETWLFLRFLASFISPERILFVSVAPFFFNYSHFLKKWEARCITLYCAIFSYRNIYSGQKNRIKPFTIEEPQNSSSNVYYAYKTRRWSDFAALKLRNVRSGIYSAPGANWPAMHRKLFLHSQACLSAQLLQQLSEIRREFISLEIARWLKRKNTGLRNKRVCVQVPVLAPLTSSFVTDEKAGLALSLISRFCGHLGICCLMCVISNPKRVDYHPLHRQS